MLNPSKVTPIKIVKLKPRQSKFNLALIMFKYKYT